MVIGVNKDIEEEEASLFVGRPLQVYEDFAGDIVQLKDLQDRVALSRVIPGNYEVKSLYDSICR